MKFEVDRKTLVIGLIAAIILISIIVIVVRSRSKYTYPPSAGDVTDNLNTGAGDLQTAIASCTTLYRAALQNNQTDSPIPKAKCIRDAVDTYFTKRCPQISSGQAPIAGSSDTIKNAYTQYSGTVQTLANGSPNTAPGTADAPFVTSASQYVNLVSNPPSYASLAVVQAARKADLTGPTRKYINAACPGFYTPADGSADPSSTYSGWTQTAATAAAPTTGYGFYPPLVSAAKVYEWALKAAKPIATSLEIATDAGGTSKLITVSPAFATALTSGTKVRIAGISGDCTVAASPTPTTTTFTVSYSSQTISTAIPVGTAISKVTSSVIASVQVGGTASALPIPAGATASTTMILNLATALDDSIVAGSAVLISGTTFSGSVTIASGGISVSRTQVTIQYSSQNASSIPAGATIENVMDIPYASPLISPPVGAYVSVDKAATTVAATSITLTLASATAGTVPTLTLPTITGMPVISSASITGTTLTLNTATAATWPAIPVGTPIFSAGAPLAAPALAAGTTPLYMKMGTLTYTSGGVTSTVKMLNWQIAQSYGPGTYAFGIVSYGST